MNSIVIARYKESLDWVLNIPEGFEIYIYNKGDPITSPLLIRKAHHIIDRPNVGRESETYIHHMMTRVTSSTDFTVYSQGDPFEHSPDFLRLLASWREWDSLQPLTWQWRSDYNIPPKVILDEYQHHLEGRLRVRPERFSLMTWANPDFIDLGAQRTSHDYRKAQGDLPEGTNVAAHFLQICGLTDIARKAQDHCLGVFCYGAIFAARNDLVARLPPESVKVLYQATMGAMVYGYLLERLWLHLFGADFELPKSRPVSLNVERSPDALPKRVSFA